jgi:hypothetical protein
MHTYFHILECLESPMNCFSLAVIVRSPEFDAAFDIVVVLEVLIIGIRQTVHILRIWKQYLRSYRHCRI